MLATGPAGIFGKIPAQGDFLRVNAGEALALARWLEEGSEAAYRAGARLGPEPVRFLHREGGRAMLGVLAGSADKVGRAFPLAVFAPLEPAALEQAPLLPVAARGLFAAAEALLADAARLAPADLAARLRALPPVSGDDLAAAGAWATGALREGAAPLLARLGGAGMPLYAAHAFRSACRPARGKEPERAAAVLDCPAGSDAEVHAWLELARRSLAWAPGFLWAAPRLLVSVGAPPPAALAALAAPSRDNPRIWPLSTTAASAVEAARKALGPALVATLEDPAVTIGELVASLSR